MAEEEKHEGNYFNLEMHDVSSQKKGSIPKSRNKVIFYVLLAIILAAVTGINIKFILCYLTKNSSYEKVDIWKSLVISDGKNLYALEMGSKTPSLLQKSTQGIVAFDLYLNETVLWNEIETTTIQSISTLYKSTESTEIWRMQAIAIDQVNNLFYILDKYAGTLSVYEPHNGIHGIVFSDLIRAHDLAVDSASGYMFILQQYDSILRCDMDGSSKMKIIEDSGISAFTINRQERLIYYASKSQGIRVMDYDGQRGTSIAQFFIKILSLAIFQNQIFWTSLTNSKDSGDSELWSCNNYAEFCDNPTRHEISLKNPTVIKSSYALQQLDNPCDNNSDCDQLCLLASNNGYSCACNMGWYFHDSSRTCQNAVTALTYVQGNFIRARHASNFTNSFSDVLLPISFYVESLKCKYSIDYTTGFYKFYISDDINIYSIKEQRDAIDGNQKKIFTVGKYSCIRNIEFDALNEYLYYLVENSIDDRSIAVLSLLNGDLKGSTKVKPPTGVFLIGAVNSLIFSPNWDNIFGPSLSTISKTKKTNNKSPLRYFNIYEMVGVDMIDNRLYWISNASVTKIEYAQINEDFKIFNRGVIDLPFMIQPMSLAIHLDWMFIANFTGIWRFDKLNGHDAVQIAGCPEKNDKQIITHVKSIVGFSTYSDRFTVNRQLHFESQIF